MARVPIRGIVERMGRRRGSRIRCCWRSRNVKGVRCSFLVVGGCVRWVRRLVLGVLRGERIGVVRCCWMAWGLAVVVAVAAGAAVAVVAAVSVEIMVGMRGRAWFVERRIRERCEAVVAGRRRSVSGAARAVVVAVAVAVGLRRKKKTKITVSRIILGKEQRVRIGAVHSRSQVCATSRSHSIVKSCPSSSINSDSMPVCEFPLGGVVVLLHDMGKAIAEGAAGGPSSGGQPSSDGKSTKAIPEAELASVIGSRAVNCCCCCRMELPIVCWSMAFAVLSLYSGSRSRLRRAAAPAAEKAASDLKFSYCAA